MSGAARVLIATLVAIAASASTSAQSLGQLAKQEEARRAATKKPARSFSNDDLGPQAIASPRAASAPAACYQSISTGGCVTADAIIAASNAKLEGEVTRRQEAAWRGRADKIRAELATARGSNNPRLVADVERRWAKLETTAEADQVPRQWLEPIPTLSTRTPQ